MRFGLFGGPVRAVGDTDDGQADRHAYEAYKRMVVEAESLGFFGAFLVEHHFTGRGQVSASLNLLSHVAALTERIRLGTAVVVVPWHNPVLLAEQAATVDVLSNGRLDLGIGRGYRDNEFRGFGVSREEARSRFDESLAVLRRAWTSIEPFSHRGRHWHFDEVIIEPRPIQVPYPPMWVGAASAESIRGAAHDRLRLLLDQVGTFEQTAERVAIYRAAQVETGQPGTDADIALTRPLLIARDAADRERLLDSHLSTLARLAGGAQNPGENPFYSEPACRRQIAEAGAIVGTPDECVDRIRRLQEAGVAQILFTRTSIDSLRLFADKVMPVFAC